MQQNGKNRKRKAVRNIRGGGMESVVRPSSNMSGHFQMPLHYPRYTKSDYENMPEWKLDCLLNQYGLPITGDVETKRKFAMGAFLWPH